MIASDWGSYISALKTEQIPFKDLHDAGCLDVFITKGDQEVEYISSLKNIAWARAGGVEVVGSYYWHYPLWDVQPQIDQYSRAIEREKPDFIALDMEGSQGQSSWAVSESGRKVAEGLVKNSGLKLFVYSSRDYINTVTPDSNKWIGQYGRWIASWPGVIPTGMDRYLSFEEIKGYPLPGWKPFLPTAWADGKYDIWQDNNWAIPEGYGWPYNHQYDWCYIPGIFDDFKRLIGMLPPLPVKPTLQEQIDELDRRVTALEILA